MAVPHRLWTSLTYQNNTKTGCEVHAPDPHSVAPIHTHLGPHLRWTTLGGEVGFFRVIEPTKAPLPQPPILASSCLCPSPAYGGRKPSPQQSPRARPHPLTVLPGSGRGHLNIPSPPKTFPQPLRPRTPTHLSVCPQEPSSRGAVGDITGRGSLSGYGARASGCGAGYTQGGPGRSPLTPQASQPGPPGVRTKPTIYVTAWCLRPPATPESPPGLLRA